MKIKITQTLAAGAASALMLASAQAASITWTGVGTFTSDTILASAGAPGSEVYGVDFGGSGTQTTANGYTFADYSTSGNMSIAGGGFGLYNAYLSGGGSTGDNGLNTVLTYGLYGSSANTGILNNLTVGQTYVVLALLADTRGAPTAGTAFYATDGTTSSADQVEAFTAGVPAIGGYSIGTFTANATTQPFSLVTQNLNGNYVNSQYNAILVEAVPEPATFALLGGGLALMLIRRSRA